MLGTVRLRDLWFLAALALVPACVLAAVGVRALANEEAAVHRDSALVAEATAARLVGTIERELDEASARTPALALDDATIARAIRAPPYAFAIVLDAAFALRFPLTAAVVADGSPRHVSVTVPPSFDSAFAACIEKSVSALTFPKSSEATQVTYPITVTPAADGK